MKRLLTIFLALAIMCSLFGCAKQQVDGPKRISTATAVMIDQACSLAQKVAMSAEPGYLQALEAPAEVISAADIFAEAVTKEPEQIKVLTTDRADFALEVNQLCNQANGMTGVACCGMLNVSTLLHMDNPPANTTAVYLRYSDKCHMVAIFTTKGTHTVSACVYPLFYETAEALLDAHFTDVQSMTQEEMTQVKEKAKGVSVTAQYTNNTVNKLYYFKLASRALTETDPIDPAKIREVISDEAVAKLAEQFAQAMVLQPTDIAVFRFPGEVEDQAQQILNQALYAEELRELTNCKVYLSWLRQISMQYGNECFLANALLPSLGNHRPIGTVANKTIQPMLAVLQLNDHFTLVMSIYPNAHNLYDYSYICLPVSYAEALSFLRDQGAKQFS